MNEADRCRFCKLFALSVLGISALLGLLGSIGFGSERAFQAFAENAVRALAPAAVGSALLLALVLWAQPLTLAGVNAELRRILLRGACVAMPGYVVACSLALLVGGSMSAAFGLPFAGLKTALVSLAGRGLLLGFVSTACDCGLVVVLAWRLAARLHALRASLPAKLVLVLTVTVPLRVTLALMLASLLPS